MEKSKCKSCNLIFESVIGCDNICPECEGFLVPATYPMGGVIELIEDERLVASPNTSKSVANKDYL